MRHGIFGACLTMHGTQNIWPWHPDTTPANQMQDPFLLMDPNLYLSSVQAMLILLYVDDILMCAHNNDQLQLSEVIEALQSYYEITNLGAGKQSLGIAVIQAKNSIQLGQSCGNCVIFPICIS